MSNRREQIRAQGWFNDCDVNDDHRCEACASCHGAYLLAELDAGEALRSRLERALVNAAVPLGALAATECDVGAIALHADLKAGILYAVRQIRVIIAEQKS